MKVNVFFAGTTDCYIVGESIKYKGNKQVSKSGATCIEWTSFGGRDYLKDANFPDGSVASASNYCRSPDKDDSPWCFTSFTKNDFSKTHNWEYCDIPDCRSSEGINSDLLVQF